MKIYQKKLIERTRLKYVLCNKCGTNIDIEKYEDFLSIRKTWGYNSSFDSETHELELCEKCYIDLISELKIEIKKTKKKKKFFCL